MKGCEKNQKTPGVKLSELDFSQTVLVRDGNRETILVRFFHSHYNQLISVHVSQENSGRVSTYFYLFKYLQHTQTFDHTAYNSTAQM